MCVVERQKLGAIHYHVIFYNLPYISFNQLLEVWQHKNEQRGLRINAIKEIDNVGSYVTKYISKEIEAIRAGKGGEIGRASCRERVERDGVTGTVEKKSRHR